MATKCTDEAASVVRDNSLFVGHVGDSRVYLVRNGKIKRLTSDHSAVTLPVRLRLVHEHKAMTDPKRSVLTRSIGAEPIVKCDVTREDLTRGDIIVQCCDGLYAFVVDDEIRRIVNRHEPAEACRRLSSLVEKRHGDDNVSIQIIRIDDLDNIRSVRGIPVYSTRPTAVPSEIANNTILDERFAVIETISRSGMASILKARDLLTDRLVAVKVPHLQFESDVGAFARFQREEEIGQELDHPNILKIYKIETKRSRPYMVMEFLEGETLNSLLERRSPLAEQEAVGLASQICSALAYLHEQGIVHRDLKPENIMLCTDGTLRVIDFGIAKSARLRRLTFAGFTPTMGTPDYMAPEQVNGRRGDHRTDIYSLGAILYEMTTGQVPFEGESPYVVMNIRTTGDPIAPRQVNDRLTPVVEEIILHALARNPRDRYSDAAAMKAELDDYEKVELVERFRTLQEPRPWKVKFRSAPLIVFFIALQLVGFGLMFWYFSHRGRH